MIGYSTCSRCGGNDPNCYVCNHHITEPMTVRYFKKGRLVWKVYPGLQEPNAFVRLADSTIAGWSESVMTMDFLADSTITEITEQEGEIQ